MNPRKPSALKLVEGTYRKDRAPKNEPKPEVACPSAPAHLSATAKAEWKRVSSELAQLGLLSRIDRAALAAYCQEWSRWVHASKMLQRPAEEGGGDVIATSAGLIASPWVNIADKALGRMHRFCVEFGMSPASRSRINVDTSLNNAPKEKHKNFA